MDMNVCLGSGGAPFSEPSNVANGAAVTLAVHRKPALCALCSPCCCYHLFYLNRLKASGIGGVIAQYKPLCSRYIGSGALSSEACAPILSSVT